MNPCFTVFLLNFADLPAAEAAFADWLMTNGKADKKVLPLLGVFAPAVGLKDGKAAKSVVVTVYTCQEKFPRHLATDLKDHLFTDLGCDAEINYGDLPL